MGAARIRLLCLLLACYAVQAGRGCGYPGSPAHASVTFSEGPPFGPGTVATYTCDPGYELLGPARRTCEENGTWTPAGVPFCVLNVAAGKAPLQSSTQGNGVAQKAVDGSTSAFFSADTCTLTEPKSHPWWYVNLLEPYSVQLVRIDWGNHAPSATVVVRVGNNRPDLEANPVCNRFNGPLEEGRPLFLPCATPMLGAFVSVHLEGAGPLSLCEVFVYTDRALPVERCPSFRDQPLGSTATYNGKCYVFYNNQPAPFDVARRFCDARSGSLVDETSPALQGFLSWELYRRHRQDSGQYWMGATRDPSDPTSWKWSSGRPVTISFWNAPGGEHNCSRFDGSRGWLWSDADCDLSLNFVCQHRPTTCGKPERPANSTILAQNFQVGSVIEYRCSPGHLLVGPNIRTCLPNGFYSEFPPKCRYLECGPPAPIPNGSLELVNGTRHYLSSVQYSCRLGFVLVGRSTLVCDVDQRWNGPPPRCEPVMCGAPPQVSNGRLRLSAASPVFGSTAEYDCELGFLLRGSSVLSCGATGFWEGEVPVCERFIPPTTTTTTTTSTTTTTTTEPSATRFHPSFVRPTRRTTTTTTTSSPPTVQTFLPPTQRPRPRPPLLEQTPRRPSRPQSSDPIAAVHKTILPGEEQMPQDEFEPTRLNMGGFIALGVFGGFVVLAAVITIIVIVIRRARSEDLGGRRSFVGGGSPTGSYVERGLQKHYEQAWDNLRFDVAKQPVSRLETLDNPRVMRTLEGYREAQEITVNDALHGTRHSGR